MCHRKFFVVIGLPQALQLWSQFTIVLLNLAVVYLLMNVLNELPSLQVELFADVVVRCCVGDLYKIRAISYRSHTTLISVTTPNFFVPIHLLNRNMYSSTTNASRVRWVIIKRKFGTPAILNLRYTYNSKHAVTSCIMS